MRSLSAISLVLLLLLASASAQQLSLEDEIRIAEARRLSDAVSEKVWPGWRMAPFSILLVTDTTEFLIGHPKAPDGFEKVGHSDRLNSEIYTRPRKFPTNLLATFPAFGDGLPVIVIGQPQNTASKSNVAWIITLMHEHFHQLQSSQAKYFQDVSALGLSRGDQTGMWMLNYDFPYEQAASEFAELKARLLEALNTTKKGQFGSKAAAYILARKKFMAGLKEDDHKYISFQLWQEGMARYTELKVAEAAAHYRPSSGFSKLSDSGSFVVISEKPWSFESFPVIGAKLRSSTLEELEKTKLDQWKRTAFYSFGGAEGLLLDRINPIGGVCTSKISSQQILILKCIEENEVFG
jgi:hypothetical protein